MASTIKVNNIQNQCGANIANKCGTTITLGASGDTITLACGASQTGFGRTGTVDWDTTAKTASFTAVSGNGYFVNTTSSAVTVTLPAGSAGSIVSLKDYANTWQTNNVTVAPNGTDKINGLNGNATLNIQDQSVTLVYVDSTKGWRAVQDSTSSVDGTEYITATGGTISTCGDYKVHTFTSPGTFCVSVGGGPLAIVDYLVVAGGGGTESNGGGGGAGGFRTSNSLGLPAPTTSPLASTTGSQVTVQGYPITVGGGGTSGGPQGSARASTNGSNSIFSTITSTGGGASSAPSNPPANPNGNPGGSGGGTYSGTAGSGNTPPVSPPQGNPGGSYPGSGVVMSSGGGAGAAGTGSSPQIGGIGSYVSNSFAVSCAGTPGPVCGARYFAGGGGGGTQSAPCSSSTKAGGAGGGGTGGAQDATNNTPGTVNTGGGGGTGNGGPASGAAGGSGIVIIRYKYQ